MVSTLRLIRLTTTSSFSNLKAAPCSVWICEPDAASVFDREVCHAREVRGDREEQRQEQVLRRVRHRLRIRRPNSLHSQPRRDLVVLAAAATCSQTLFRLRPLARPIASTGVRPFIFHRTIRALCGQAVTGCFALWTAATHGPRR